MRLYSTGYPFGILGPGSVPSQILMPLSPFTGRAVQHCSATTESFVCYQHFFFTKHNIIPDTTKKTNSVSSETRTRCPANFEHIISLKWRDESASVSECWCTPTTERWIGAGLGNVLSLDGCHRRTQDLACAPGC